VRDREKKGKRDTERDREKVKENEMFYMEIDRVTFFTVKGVNIC
jgi:hypothetical protein